MRTLPACLALLVPIGCASGPSFETEEVLTFPGWAACADGNPALYIPGPLGKHIAVRLDAPEPPYEVRGLSVALLQSAQAYAGRTCSTQAAISLAVFVDDAEEATDFEGKNKPRYTALAGGELTGGKGKNGTVREAALTLDEPVLVEEEGYLWVVYQALGGDEDPMPCVAACDGAEMPPAWQWSSDDSGFARMTTSRPGFRVTVGR
ncbi:MAG: hypothetical protein H6732_17460 [Alphaproteobacteria bacterium]|nr:hypothetical protein [Alphaproteobacteria bacterium]